MEIIQNSEKGKFPENKKYSTSVKDVKRKLFSINKRINELQHKRKSVYKNSVKAKKMVHNQINQIVRHFRARERNITLDIDEAYFSQDANINDELSRLQSVYSHCQALFNHIEDFKEKSGVIRDIDTILSGINPNENPDIKPLEFLSDFDMMKAKADSYGYLEGDFVKNDVVYVGAEKDNKLSDDNCKLFQNKELPNQSSCKVKDYSNISNQKSSFCKISDSDDFQIIDLLDNMNCQDLDDFVMDEDVNLNSTPQNEKKLSNLMPNKDECTIVTKECNISRNSSKINDENIDFNPEEEWKHILEMNKKLASWPGMTSKETESNAQRKDIPCNKKASPCGMWMSKETVNWFNVKYLEKAKKEETSDKFTSEMNSMPPEKVIQASFKSYFVKDDIHNWLSTH